MEKKSNIVGETTVTINGYQKQGEGSPYYAEPGDPLFERLQAIIDGDLVLDDLKTDIVEVKLWDKDTAGRTRRARGMLHRDRQLRRRYHRLPDPLQHPLHRRQDQGVRLTRQARNLRRRDRQKRAAAGRLPHPALRRHLQSTGAFGFEERKSTMELKLTPAWRNFPSMGGGTAVQPG